MEALINASIMTKRIERPLTPRLLKAARMLAEGYSEGEVAKKLNVARGTPSKWKKKPAFKEAMDRFNRVEIELVEHEATEARKVESEKYIDELRAIKERQKKWSAVVTESGIKAVKMTNRWLSEIDEFTKKPVLSDKEILLVRMTPTYLRAISEMVRTASDSEDKAFALTELAEQLNEYSNSIKILN